jgi:hypothetical protein
METTHHISKTDSESESTTVWTFAVKGDEVTVYMRVAVAQDEDCSIDCPDWGGGMRAHRTVSKVEARKVYASLRAKGYR